MPRAFLTAVSLVLGVGMAPAACFTSSDGLEPPNTIYYPTGLVVSPGLTTLYVTNSDFDLQYNGGTVQAVDLTALRGALGSLADALGAGMGAVEACSTVGLVPNDNVVLNPGPCLAIPLDSLVQRFATIGAFASGAILVHNPAGPGARLLVPVRGDPSITFFDVSDDRGGSDGFRLECGASADDPEQRCSGAHRIGEDAGESIRGLTLPVEPVGIAAAESVGANIAVVTAHQTVTAASLTVINSGDWSEKPTLEHYITSLPQGPTEVVALPIPARLKSQLLLQPDGCAGAGTVRYQPGFFLTYRAAAELDTLRFNDDACSAPPRPFISRVGAIGINANADGSDSRGVAVDAGERQACEASCEASETPTPAELACLETCAAIPIGLYVANRTPASLLVGHVETRFEKEGDVITGAVDLPTIFDSVPLSFGASKLAVGKVIDRDGILRTRIFAVAFDSRLVFSYDPEARRIEAVIRTGRGPHAIAFDTASDHSFMYVGHFTDSYIGVVDLDMRRPQTFGSMFATVGAPTPPRESK